MLRLVHANLNYSSWSMRVWLALKLASAEFKALDVGLKTKEGWKEKILSFSGAGKVPILIDGPSSIHESVAICETLAERFPDAGLWPEDPALRARARAVSCEMAAGFHEVRNRMPTNLRGRSDSTPQGEALAAEIARVIDILDASLSTSTGDFLLGGIGIVDCMYFPVLTRFRTYGVEVPDSVEKYRERVFAHPVVQELFSIAESTDPIPEFDALLTA